MLVEKWGSYEPSFDEAILENLRSAILITLAAGRGLHIASQTCQPLMFSMHTRLQGGSGICKKSKKY
jgi:hypothetical protein